MKAFITLFDKRDTVDGTLLSLFRGFERSTLQDCDVVIVPITYFDEYQANEWLMELVLSMQKRVVVFDFVEYGWDVLKPNHIFTVNTIEWAGKFRNQEYLKLDRFLAGSNVILYFKRELLADNKLQPKFKVLPAEYPGVSTLPEPVHPATYDEFTNRPIDIIMVWGLSNPSRPILHGELAKQTALNGQHLVSSLEYFNECQRRGEKRMVVLAHIPDFARVSIHQILHLQSLAKISISLGGAGFKCFRDSEASYNCVMARQKNPLEWSYPWLDGINCIDLPNRTHSTLIDENRSYEKLMAWLDSPEQLYKVYLQGINNWKNYDANNYANDYILKEVSRAF
jgi:hypothetical protein